MNENINLVEILKDCPPKTPLYSAIHGDVEFLCIDRDNPTFPIKLLISNTKYYVGITKEGKYTDNWNGECILFPSKEQRDWSKFNINKPKFTLDTLKPFDMKEKELNERLLKMEEQLKEDCLNVHDFIWQKQEGQNDCFDNFNKTQQIAFVNLYSKVQALRDCLVSYNNWFVK